MRTYQDILEARGRIAEQIVLTPCTPSDVFKDLFDGRAWFKFENLQRTGSFKDRGSLNALLLLNDKQRAQGVVAASAGNHAQGLAYHAARLKIPVTIVMPERTPLIKVSNTERMGARVILHGVNYNEALLEAKRLSEAEGTRFISAFDDPAVIAGQGTIGLELLEQVPEMDCILVPLGGGGLISGIAVAVKQARPEVKIIGVQSSAYPAAVASRMAGGRVVVDPSETIADGIAIRQVGENTYPLIEEYVDDLVVVGEDEIANAVLLLLEREKTVAEGAAATTLAALVNDRVKGVEGRNVVMVLSGGNIDVNLISRIIERGLTVDGRLTTLHVRIKDRPGGLATLSTLLASQGGNVLHLDHRRGGLSVSEVDIVVTLETRGIPHVEAIIHELRRHGYAVTTQ